MRARSNLENASVKAKPSKSLLLGWAAGVCVLMLLYSSRTYVGVGENAGPSLNGPVRVKASAESSESPTHAPTPSATQAPTQTPSAAVLLLLHTPTTTEANEKAIARAAKIVDEFPDVSKYKARSCAPYNVTTRFYYGVTTNDLPSAKLEEIPPDYLVEEETFEPLASEMRSEFDSQKWLVMDSHGAVHLDNLFSVRRYFGLAKKDVHSLHVGVYSKISTVKSFKTQNSVELPDWTKKMYWQVSGTPSKGLSARLEKAKTLLGPVASNYTVVWCGFTTRDCENFSVFDHLTIFNRLAHSLWHNGNRSSGRRKSQQLLVGKRLRGRMFSGSPWHVRQVETVAPHMGLIESFPLFHLEARSFVGSRRWDYRKTKNVVVFEGFRNLRGTNSFMENWVETHANDTSYRIALTSSFIDLSNTNDFKVSDRLDVKLAVCSPYAAHTAKWNEFYALGVPMLMPSKKLLSNVDKVLEKRDKRKLHFQHLDYLSDACSLEDRIDSFDFYNLPFIEYFDEWSELAVKIEEMVRPENQRKLWRNSVGMREFVAEVEKRMVPRIRSVVYKALKERRDGKENPDNLYDVFAAAV